MIKSFKNFLTTKFKFVAILFLTQLFFCCNNSSSNEKKNSGNEEKTETKKIEKTDDEKISDLLRGIYLEVGEGKDKKIIDFVDDKSGNVTIFSTADNFNLIMKSVVDWKVKDKNLFFVYYRDKTKIEPSSYETFVKNVMFVDKSGNSSDLNDTFKIVDFNAERIICESSDKKVLSLKKITKEEMNKELIGMSVESSKIHSGKSQNGNSSNSSSSKKSKTYACEWCSNSYSHLGFSFRKSGNDCRVEQYSYNPYGAAIGCPDCRINKYCSKKCATEACWNK